jgi:lipoyl(octanoyl) transferase
MRWRFLKSPPLSGADNMALDEALLQRAAACDEAVLRIYAWRSPTMSLGRNQVARGAYDLERARTRGVAFVRRPTGGRALMHDREVTYSVTAPVRRLGDMRESYDRINRLLLDGLRALGVEALVCSAGQEALRPGTTPCFELPAAGEITAGGRKLVGSAQWRDGDALLQHGSILLGDDQALAAELLAEACEPPPRPATLGELVGSSIDHCTVAEALVESLRRREDPAAEPLSVENELETRAAAAAARYRDEGWTWRR